MLQEFLDEVLDPSLQPDTNPRYTIRDNNGRIISDDVQIDMKTPVLQNPTPLNRASIRNFQGDLYTQDRYNTPTYSNLAMSLNLPLSSYEVGKVVKITSPITTSNGKLNINDLGNKSINGKINAGKSYNLVYNGESWDINNTQIITGSYSGNDSESRTISLGFKPEMLFVWGKPNSPGDITVGVIFCQIASDNKFLGTNAADEDGSRYTPSYSIISLTSNGFQISGNNSGNVSIGQIFGYNLSEATYNYIAVK